MINYSFASEVKKALDRSIQELDSIKTQFLMNSKKDFSRKRLFDFSFLIRFCLQMSGSSLQNEILKFFTFRDDSPTSSAFCQRRSKVLPDAFAYLYRIFTDRLTSIEKLQRFRGKYLLLAVDGSDLNIPFNPNDKDTLYQILDKHPFNRIHLTVLYDILNGIYHDAVLAPQRSVSERFALNTMADRFPRNSEAVFIADRGFEGYNTFAHLFNSVHHFVIRMKDIHSNGILASHNFPDEEFDTTFSTILTRKHTREVLNNKDKYTVLTNKSSFDFLTDENPFYKISFRVIRIQIAPGVYECLATNLDAGEFSMDDIKELYRLRWGVETSFRNLKYTLDLVHMHSRKRSSVEQEIWAKLITYNFCEAIVRHVARTRQERKDNDKQRKWDYKINFATAASICKAYLRGDSEISVCRLIGRYLIPIRPNRRSERNIKTQKAQPFLYRAA